MEQALRFTEIKKRFPGEWVLLGNPVMDGRHIDVVSGVPIFHSKDKKEVCYIGRDMTAAFDKITLVFTGSVKPARKMTGIFNRLQR